MTTPTLREAAPLLLLIQRLNANPYSLTKSECIHEAEQLRAELAAQPVPDAAIYAATSERTSPDWHAGFRAGLDAGKACAVAAHPQQPARVPLTDAQIDAACGPCDDSDMGRALRAEFIKRFRIVYGRLAVIVPAPTTDQSHPQR